MIYLRKLIWKTSDKRTFVDLENKLAEPGQDRGRDWAGPRGRAGPLARTKTGTGTWLGRDGTGAGPGPDRDPDEAQLSCRSRAGSGPGPGRDGPKDIFYKLKVAQF